MTEDVALLSPILRGLGNGLRISQALYVAAELGLADHLAERPMTSTELARLTGTDAGALGRLLRALCAMDVLRGSTCGHFELRPVGALLRSDVPGSWRAGIRFTAGPVRWRCWSQLLDAVLTGSNAAERVLGQPLFDFYASHPDESKIHDDAMRSFSAGHAAAVVACIEPQEGSVVVDVGGGTGELLAALLAAHPHCRGVVFDLPNVAARCGEVLDAYGVSDRCRVERGSFFEHVPPDGDVYILKNIIHDWDDLRSTDILRACRRCMPRHARLLLVEREMPETVASGAEVEAFLTDLEMLVMSPDGRERTESEFRMLLDNAGFKLRKVERTASPLSLFEATVV